MTIRIPPFRVTVCKSFHNDRFAEMCIIELRVYRKICITMKKEFRRIGQTPISISIYSVEEIPTYINERGFLEIVFCLKGSVKFAYGYEEFTLHEGEYISVDKDAYYLYDGRDNMCVSLLFDLKPYETEHPYILDTLFVCEGLTDIIAESSKKDHNRLKGMLIGLLKYMVEDVDEELIAHISAKIVTMFVERFDIFFFHTKYTTILNNDLDGLRKLNSYMHRHMKEKITLTDLAKLMNFTEGYMSEYMRKNSIGFREMISYIRANESEHYLMNTDKTILEISEECGFSDTKYYYSAFRRWYKCTPKQFRNQYKSSCKEKIEYLEFEDIAAIVDKLMTEHYWDTFLR